MAKKIQPYSSVNEFAARHNLILPRPFCWRLIAEPRTGEISGISGIRGFAIATNGILVAIEDNVDIAFGHLDFFVPDADITPGVQGSSRSTAKKTPQININEYN